MHPEDIKELPHILEQSIRFACITIAYDTSEPSDTYGRKLLQGKKSGQSSCIGADSPVLFSLWFDVAKMCGNCKKKECLHSARLNQIILEEKKTMHLC